MNALAHGNETRTDAKEPFSTFIEQLNVQKSLYCFSTLAGAWGISMPQMPNMLLFHLVTKGRCVVELDAGKFIELSEGSLVLIPHGKGHNIKSAPQSQTIPYFESNIHFVSPSLEFLTVEGEGDCDELVCGVITLGQGFGSYLVEQFPASIYFEEEDYKDSAWLLNTVELIKNESEQLSPGSETIITKLSEVIVVQFVRHWLSQPSNIENGWFNAVTDSKVGPALHAIHCEPSTKWDVDTLANLANMSRSAFSARFTKLMNKSVKAYLTEWRIYLAHHKLSTQKIQVSELAELYCYDSEASFSRAFKRIIGTSPSKVKMIVT